MECRYRCFAAMWCKCTTDSQGSPAEGDLPTSSYLEFLSQDQAYCSSARFRRDLEYWRQRITQVPDPIFLPRQRAGAPDQLQPLQLRTEISRDRYGRFLEACREAGVRPLPVLLGLVGVLLMGASRQREFVLGV